MPIRQEVDKKHSLKFSSRHQELIVIFTLEQYDIYISIEVANKTALITKVSLISSG